jgi:hypothetical protein
VHERAAPHQSLYGDCVHWGDSIFNYSFNTPTGDPIVYNPYTDAVSSASFEQHISDPNFEYFDDAAWTDKSSEYTDDSAWTIKSSVTSTYNPEQLRWRWLYQIGALSLRLLYIIAYTVAAPLPPPQPPPPSPAAIVPPAAICHESCLAAAACGSQTLLTSTVQLDLPLQLGLLALLGSRMLLLDLHSLLVSPPQLGLLALPGSPRLDSLVQRYSPAQLDLLALLARLAGATSARLGGTARFASAAWLAGAARLDAARLTGAAVLAATAWLALAARSCRSACRCCPVRRRNSTL